ncbi:hypothetical protein B9T19_03790 [Ignatzschineria sp. F8392]|uniref:TipJ family phage tail tip protein n=1 Tax=Ignatzschineria sp. F8392 TaxID=1980117 RepID=UPI000B981724|nr:phage tail protein [Ignatzschineria sp. F8392]OYQ81794.1 hypothetical protein B9T19_03790 [Ignatzschineria sp. F8392]
MGGKKGGGARTPNIAPNTLESHQKLKVLDLISSGEVYSLEHGDEMPLRSIYLNDTPIQNEDGSLNFKGVRVEYAKGAVDQDYLPNFSSVSTSVNVGAEVKRDQPITRTIVNPEITSLRVTVGVDALMRSTKEGDQLPTDVNMTISIIKDNNYYASKVFSLHEKGSHPYYQDFVFNDLPPAPFSIHCVRNTPDSNSDLLRNKTFFYSYVESVDAKFRYPKLAICGLEIDSEQFGNNVPTRTYGLKGAIVQIPSNYNPVTREYDGLWDRLFKPGYTNNPAWILYDLLTNETDGFGDRLKGYRIDIDKLYQLAKYCDVLVDDGNGGKEPRFVCNAVIQGNDAYKVLYDVCSTFRGIPVFHNDRFTVYYDHKADVSAVYNNSNVIDGLFDYSFTSRQDQHNQIQVQYIDKEDGYRTKIDEVSDEAHIAKYGLNTLSITAFGATSRSYALRMAKWNLVTNLTENEFVSFKVGLEGIRHAIYDIIQIADNDYAGTSVGGRVIDIDGDTITLDRDVSDVESFFIMNREAKSVSYRVKRRLAGDCYQLDKVVDAEEYSAFNAVLKHVEPRLFRCISISEDAEEGVYTIVAVKHNPQKEAIVDEAAEYIEPNHSIINTLPQLVNGHTSNNGREIILKWDSLEVAGKQNEYRIELLKDQALYKTYRTKENQLVLTNLPQGEYVAKVRAINSAGQFSEELIIAFSTTYRIDGLRARPIVFGIELHWQLPALITTEAYTEIWYSDVDDRTKASKLAVLPYPQSNHTVSGLSVGDELFFWFRLVDADGNQGEFSYTLKGRASDSADGILGYFQNQITTKEISSEAVDEIIEQAKKEIDFDDVVDPGDIDKIIERAKEEISFNDIATSVDIDKIIDQSLTNAKESADEIVKESGIVSNINQKVGSAELDAKLLELSKVTADRAIHAETQTNRVSIGDHYAEMILQKISEVTNSKQLASQYLSLVAQNEIAKAEFLLSQIAQATTDNAFAREIHSLTASFLENEASIKSLKETVTNEFEATAKTIDQLKANVDETIQSEINNVNEVIAEKEEATVKSVEKLQTDINDLDHNLSAEIVLSKLSQVTGDSQLSQQVFALIAENERAKAELLLSQLAQTTDTKALVQEVLSLTAEYLENRAEVEEFRKATATEFESTARSIDKMHSEFSSEANKLNADLILSKMSQATGDAQLAQQYLSLLVQNEKAQAEFVLSQLAQTTKTEALVQEISALSASFLENRAKIEEFRKATATEFESTARSIEKMHSEFSSEANKLNADLILSKMSQATGDAQLAQQYLSLLVQNEKAQAELILSQLAQTTDTKALVQEIRSLTASFLDSRASIDNLQKIMVEENQSLASDITNVKASIKEQESRITQNAEAIVNTDGTVKSQYTLTTEAIKNGKKVVSGFTSVNDGETSEFLIQADKFAIVNLKNGQIAMPFIIANGKLVMDGDMIGTGTISGDKLVVGTSMKAPIIKGGRIESGHFAGGSINIGNGNFNVDSKGNLYAKSGRFEGEVFAKKIKGGIVDLVQFNDIRIDRAHIDVNRGARYYLKAEDMDYIYTLKPFLVRVSNGNVSVSVIRDDGKLIGRGVTTSGYWTASEYLIDDLSEVDIYVKKGTTRYVDINLRYHGARGSYAHIKSVNFQRIMRTEAPIRVAPIRNYGM